MPIRAAAAHIQLAADRPSWPGSWPHAYAHPRPGPGPGVPTPLNSLISITPKKTIA